MVGKKNKGSVQVVKKDANYLKVFTSKRGNSYQRDSMLAKL